MKVTVNNFHKATQKLNTLLRKKKPITFNPLWIKLHAKNVYMYLCKNFRSETGDVDWDIVTVNLDRTFQKRWKRYEKKIKDVPYENKEELSLVLSKYHDKLYTLAAQLDKEDKEIQGEIIIHLVRTAQKGNLLAKEYAMECMTYVIYDWVEHSRQIARWKGHENEIKKKIQSCIRNYRYSGNFMTYLYMMMKFLKRDYYVGLYSAAALHGASHQQPQNFCVVTKKPFLRNIRNKLQRTFFGLWL